MINVTKTFLPPVNDYKALIDRIWDNEWLTNNGEFYKKLKEELKEFLSIKHVIPMTNGTLPIQIALNAYGNGGEVITTPFSYVATTASIVWEKCKPIFVDIDPQHLTIDETKIEEKITDKTTCILATHVYGNPCNVIEIDKIAKKYNLKVIYDAAHCFGVQYNNQSIFNFGDVSTCSFHATKLFHTGEGGALFCQNSETYHEMFYRHNFGHNGPIEYHGLGINAKMSEFQAAMGLCVLPFIDKIIDEREKVCSKYDADLNFNSLTKLLVRENTLWNYSYYPIIFNSEKELLITVENLNKSNIFPRRYFYPSLDQLPYVEASDCEISFEISSRVLCLPLFVGISEKDQNNIINIINQSL